MLQWKNYTLFQSLHPFRFSNLVLHSAQFSSVAQLCPTLCLHGPSPILRAKLKRSDDCANYSGPQICRWLLPWKNSPPSIGQSHFGLIYFSICDLHMCLSFGPALELVGTLHGRAHYLPEPREMGNIPELVNNNPGLTDSRAHPCYLALLGCWHDHNFFHLKLTHGQRSLAGYSPRSHKRVRRDRVTTHQNKLRSKTTWKQWWRWRIRKPQ